MNEKRIVLSGLLAGVLTVSAVEGFVRSHHDGFKRRFTQTREAIVLQKDAVIAECRTPADVLFLGDSTMEAAIDPLLFEKATGLRAMNLALNGNLITYSDYRMLKSYLAKFSPPKAVVVWHTIDVWERDLNLADFFFTLPSWADQRRVVANSLHNIDLRKPNVIHWPVKTLGQLIQGAFFRYLQTYRFKVWLKKDAARFAVGFDPVGMVDRLPAKAADPTDQIQRQIKDVRKIRVLVTKDCRYWFEQFMVLAGAHGVHVLTARSPIHETLIKDPAVRDLLDRQNRVLDGFFGGFPSVLQLNNRNPVFTAAESRGDKDHVSQKGRVFLTAYYARILKDVFGNERQAATASGPKGRLGT